NAVALTAILDGVFARRDLAEWRSILEGAGVTFGAVYSVNEAADDSQAREIGALVPFADGKGLTVSSPFHLDDETKTAPGRARGVELTDYGQTLLRHAEAVHVQVGDASSEIAALRSGTFGAVSVGAGPAWLRRHLPLAVAQTVARHPGIRIKVGGGFDEQLFTS